MPMSHTDQNSDLKNIKMKSHLKIKWLWCLIYLEVIGIESPIALSNKIT